MILRRLALLLGAVIVPAAARAEPPLLPGYHVLASATLSAGQPRRMFRIVALGRDGEGESTDDAAPRPLLILEKHADGDKPVARNDHVVMRADGGGQCDPFLENGYGMIAVRGRFFTIENGVACGQHWTDFITFRFDPVSDGFVFDSERIQSWSPPRTDSPDAEALAPDGPPQVIRDKPGQATPFAAWRPKA